jgi:sulfate transport system ATP-binding protein
VREVYASPATPFVYKFLGAVNEFRGHVEGGDLRIGKSVIPHAVSDGSGSGEVVAFARPHELEILPEDDRNAVGVPAQVSRILSVGPLARVELNGLNGTGGFFEVELSSQRLSELKLATGQPVRIVSSHLRVFESGASS